uniref:SR-related CTD associated factor 8 n=1 Tax=Eptatretus burgeri TaxID=7764 RepID=A0A8C4NM72_EPTBU
MTQLTKAAIKAIKLYKHVVQSVEKFILKCRPEYKVPGLYVIDSIVRQSRHQFGAERDVFGPRFAKNVSATFHNLYKCPSDDKSKIVRVLNLWQKNVVFTSDIIQPLLDMAIGLPPPTSTPTGPPAGAANIQAGNTPGGSPTTPLTPAQAAAQVAETWPAGQTLPNADAIAAVAQLLQSSQSQQLLQSLQQKPIAPSLDPGLVAQVQALTAQLTAAAATTSKPPVVSLPPILEPSNNSAFDKKLLDRFDYDDEPESMEDKPEPVHSFLQDEVEPVKPIDNAEEIHTHLSVPQEETFQEQLARLTQPEPQSQMYSPNQVQVQVQVPTFTPYSQAYLPPAPPPSYPPPVEQPVDMELDMEIEQPEEVPAPGDFRQQHRSRSRSPSSHRSHSHSHSHSHYKGDRRRRSRDKDRDRERERDRDRDRDRGRERDRRSRRSSRSLSRERREQDRQRRGLPPLQNATLSVLSTTLWVGQLDKRVIQQDIAAMFQEFGPIESINMIPPRGCAYVCMTHRHDALRALHKLSKGLKIHSKMIKIAWALNKGVKSEHKKFWDVDLGASFIPWNLVKAEMLESFTDGGIIDQDSVNPEWEVKKFTSERDVTEVKSEEGSPEFTPSTPTISEPVNPIPPPTITRTLQVPPVPLGLVQALGFPTNLPAMVAPPFAPSLLHPPFARPPFNPSQPPPGFLVSGPVPIVPPPVSLPPVQMAPSTSQLLQASQAMQVLRTSQALRTPQTLQTQQAPQATRGSELPNEVMARIPLQPSLPPGLPTPLTERPFGLRPPGPPPGLLGMAPRGSLDPLRQCQVTRQGSLVSSMIPTIPGKPDALDSLRPGLDAQSGLMTPRATMPGAAPLPLPVMPPGVRANISKEGTSVCGEESNVRPPLLHPQVPPPRLVAQPGVVLGMGLPDNA